MHRGWVAHTTVVVVRALPTVLWLASAVAVPVAGRETGNTRDMA